MARPLQFPSSPFGLRQWKLAASRTLSLAKAGAPGILQWFARGPSPADATTIDGDKMRHLYFGVEIKRRIFMLDLFSLKGKAAIVTGAAQGIGREIALGFARYGADIAAVDLNGKRLQSLRGEIEAMKRRCLVITVDLGQTAQIEQMVETAVKEMGRIDILANIAGVNVHKPAEEMTEKDWDFVQDINLKSLFFCCQAVGKVMLR
ncbi:MAG: SDR family NAD(P)-dependent oxidoreductase, partial [Deltaproteobacteria bacterium]|nr:SDR family NAD(P)-dependent oxidoreductase [Deltaproteobacteria bacterium]